MLHFLSANIHLRRWSKSANLTTRPRLFYSRRTAIETFASLLDDEAKQRGFSAWLEKTPFHLHYVKELENTLDDVYFVYVCRGIRGNINSLVEALPHWNKGVDESDFSYAVSRWFGDMALLKARAQETNSHIIDYDKLLKDPESENKKLYTFLGLKNHEALQSSNLSTFSELVVRKDESWKKNNFQSGILQTKTAKSISPEMTERLPEIIEFICEKAVQ
jgi:hypothetical protein